MQRTIVIIKPDAVQRGLCGEILTRFEKKQFSIVTGGFGVGDRKKWEQHYDHLSDKPFFEDIISQMTSGPCMFLFIQGPDVINDARRMIGSTDPQEAAPGTIRGDLAHSIRYNLVHASDSIDSVEREFKIWFQP